MSGVTKPIRPSFRSFSDAHARTGFSLRIIIIIIIVVETVCYKYILFYVYLIIYISVYAYIDRGLLSVCVPRVLSIADSRISNARDRVYLKYGVRKEYTPGPAGADPLVCFLLEWFSKRDCGGRQYRVAHTGVRSQGRR